MKTTDPRTDPRRAGVMPMALGPRDAAKALGISERTLWGLTAPRGPIPCVKAGTRVLYRSADLDAWLVASRITEGGTR